MKRTSVVVPWDTGLHLRHAATLVRTAEKFRSAMSLTCGGRNANVRSIISVIALCATMGTVLDLETVGDDEQEAASAIEQVFASADQSGVSK